MKTLAGYVPANLVQPFAENLILSVVLLALLLGFALRAVRGEPDGRGGGARDRRRASRRCCA